MMTLPTEPTRPTVIIAGGGAAGTLTAIHLIRASARRSSPIDLVVLEPSDRIGAGTAYGTPYEEHLLNVPASGMSALPEDPGHFLAWNERTYPGERIGPMTFLPRRRFGLYLADLVAESLAGPGVQATLRHLRVSATGARRTPTGVAVLTSDGRELVGSGLVVATGLAGAGRDWVPESLARSAFFVPDPWAPGAIEVVRRDHSGPADVLLVGTGLTAVDLALVLSAGPGRTDRRVIALSRGGRLPRVHRPEPVLAAIPEIDDWGNELDGFRVEVRRHLARVSAATGDWRPAVDGLRHRVAALWQRLDEDDRERFLRDDAAGWNVLRHRMSPVGAVALEALRDTGRFEVRSGCVQDVRPLAEGGLDVGLADGSRAEVGWVVNCTSPAADLREVGNPLLDDLLRDRTGVRLATAATAGMGLRTRDGRLIDGDGAAEAPLWTLGALRRGELWESTAVPEIRTQAAGLAVAVLDALVPLPRRLEDGRLVGGHHPVARPRDPLGLPLSTTAEAAAAFNAGLERVMRLQSGGEDLIRSAVELDPGFAVAQATLAMLGYEAGAATDVPGALAAARSAIGRRGDAREGSFVETVAARIEGSREVGARALMNHIAQYPRDVLAVSAAVPTIAFSGVTDVQREAWDLVEGLAPAYGDHWWYISLLAFVRQDQGRFDEAGLLAEAALSCEPSSGHAVHAQTHVLYETGQHEAGRNWLDHWVAESGRSASHRAHFSWHAALHELALGDLEAVRQRYYSQLAPPAVCGVRGLVDSASLLWRWQVAVVGWGDQAGTPPVGPVLDVVGAELLRTPQTPFIAVHAAVGLAAAADLEGLHRLRRHCAAGQGALRTVVVGVCDALLAVAEERWETAATLLAEVLPELHRVGGSAAQREVIEETWLLCLLRAGRAEEAAGLLDSRLDRRPSPLDLRRQAVLLPA